VDQGKVFRNCAFLPKILGRPFPSKVVGFSPKSFPSHGIRRCSDLIYNYLAKTSTSIVLPLLVTEIFLDVAVVPAVVVVAGADDFLVVVLEVVATGAEVGCRETSGKKGKLSFLTCGTKQTTVILTTISDFFLVLK